MGTAAGVAESVKAVLEGYGHHTDIINNFTQHTLKRDDVLLVCTSNTGMGDLPQNIIPFFKFLLEENPPIAGLQYGVINLGDSSYMSFAEAGKILDDKLADLGANRLGEPLVIDAIYDDDPEEKASEWIADWQSLIR